MLRKIPAIVLVLLLLTMSASADFTAPTTYSVGYKMWSKFWDMMGGNGIRNGTIGGVGNNVTFLDNAGLKISADSPPRIQVMASLTNSTMKNITINISQYSLLTNGSINTTGDTSALQYGTGVTIYYAPVTLTSMGQIGSITVVVQEPAPSGNIKGAIFSDNSNAPGTRLVQSASQAKVIGNNIIPTPLAYGTVGTKIWVAYMSDNADGIYAKTDALGSYEVTTYGAAFHATATPTGGGSSFMGSVNGFYTTTGNITSANITVDAVSLSSYSQLRLNVSNGSSLNSTAVQVQLFGNSSAYATPLDSTLFTINVSNPVIVFDRKLLDTITASSSNQTVWNMNVSGGMAALPNTGTILAQEIGVLAVKQLDKSALGDFSDVTVLTADADYVVDYSNRTATSIILTSGTSIVNAQSKIRISWIANIINISGVHNDALQAKIFLNRNDTSEVSPFIAPLNVGTGKYVELDYTI